MKYILIKKKYGNDNANLSDILREYLESNYNMELLRKGCQEASFLFCRKREEWFDFSCSVKCCMVKNKYKT